jgi:hypothetical protein
VRSRQARAWSVAFGVVSLPGLVLGHLAAYALAYPSAEQRAQHLHHTSHEAFPALTVVALALLVVALSLAAMGGLRSGDRPTVRRVALRLPALQCTAFLALELTERDLHLVATITDPAVLVGAVLQIPVAVGLAYLLAGFAIGVRQLTVRWQIRPVPLSPPKASWSFRRPGPVRPAPFLDQARERGPPALAA